MTKRYHIRRAESEDSEALITLINDTPQEGGISLNFERSPNFFMPLKQQPVILKYGSWKILKRKD